MSTMQRIRQVAGDLARGEDPGQAVSNILDPADFVAAREQGQSVGTRIEQMSVPLDEAGQVVNRSFSEREGGGFVNVISPVVIPEGGNLRRWWPPAVLVLLGLVGLLVAAGTGFGFVVVGPHYWAMVAVVVALAWWRRSVVMIPEGCQALITRFGKLEQVADPGRVMLFSPWKRVSYVVNTTREYPFNAPIREAPTESGVLASVDLFLQFRIEDPAEFIFVLGSVRGFADKLANAVSEVTRSLIYQQRAEDIYDLVGENTQDLVEGLNAQFLPAVRLTNANITHAEPTSKEYRMDLAATEVIRVAKEAYTYEYELRLRKEQNEGDLNKELASLTEGLSAIQADIAGYQAQMDTALERETNRAKAMARQRYVEVESSANANAALLQAQALDIGAVSAAGAPEILQYRFEQDVLDKLEGIAQHLPQLIALGDGADSDGASGRIDFLALARQLMGLDDAALFSEADMAAIRERIVDIEARIRGREPEIVAVLEAADADAAEPDAPVAATGDADNGEVSDQVAEIRASVTDSAVTDRVQALGGETR